MSKKIKVGGQEYDSRSVVDKAEILKLPNHPKVNAVVIPLIRNERHSGSLKVIVKIPFGELGLTVKEIHLTINSPRRIDAINRVVEEVKKTLMYRRKIA